MKLGFVSAILADEPFDGVIDCAAREGFSCVEVMCWPKGEAERRYAGVTHIDVNHYDAGMIRDTLAQKRVAISGLGYYPNPLDSDPEKCNFYVRHIQDVIEACAKLGIPVMNTFIGRDHSKNIEDNFASFRKIWPPIVRFAEDNGVRIGIENCPMYFTIDEWPGGKNLATTPAIWRRMFNEIPSPSFGLNYDPSHLLWQEIDYLKPLSEFKDRIFHVHLKDAKVYPEKRNEVGILAAPLEFYQPKLPGLGDIRWGAFISALHDIRYEGCSCIEIEDRGYEGSPDKIRSALRQSRTYLQQFFIE